MSVGTAHARDGVPSAGVISATAARTRVPRACCCTEEEAEAEASAHSKASAAAARSSDANGAMESKKWSVVCIVFYRIQYRNE